MSLENFRVLLKQHLRQAGYSHKELAEQLGWHPSLLSNKLYERNYATLTHAEVRQIVQILTQWQAFTSSQQSLMLLAEMGLEESSLAQAPKPTAVLPLPLPLHLEGPVMPFAPRVLYGRQEELIRLEQAILSQKARLVGITGLGGSGKSALALSFAHSVQDNFELVVWYSLGNAPTFHQALAAFLQSLDTAQRLPSEAAVGEMHLQLGQLLECLQQARCLLILDNFENVLASGELSGSYLSGYEGYGRLVQLVGGQAHQSCLLLTSREKPKELITLEGRYPEKVLSLSVGGLNTQSARLLLEEEANGDKLGLSGNLAQWEELVRYYSGNPLALKLLGRPLHKLFGGNLKALLAPGWGMLTDIAELLAEQLERVSEVEQEILYWLAVEQQALSLEELLADFGWRVTVKELAEALLSLVRRSLLQGSSPAGYFGLPPLLLEYLSERLIRQVVEELTLGQVGSFLSNYALLKKRATSAYLGEEPPKRLLWAILERLRLEFKSEPLVIQRLWELVDQARHREEEEEQDYALENLLHLLLELKVELSDAELSRLQLE